jgi:TRAP-type C4-dicarboxylate transport system substrate-binding protein
VTERTKRQHQVEVYPRTSLEKKRPLSSRSARRHRLHPRKFRADGLFNKRGAFFAAFHFNSTDLWKFLNGLDGQSCLTAWPPPSSWPVLLRYRRPSFYSPADQILEDLMGLKIRVQIRTSFNMDLCRNRASATPMPYGRS